MIYEGALTEAFKEIIINELYDTGALYESMQIYSFENEGVITFDVQCNDYIVYHIQRLDLLDRLIAFPEFQEAYLKYTNIYLESELRISLSSIDAADINPDMLIPRCVVTVNGE
jgi:hypothetical protein